MVRLLFILILLTKLMTATHISRKIDTLCTNCHMDKVSEVGGLNDGLLGCDFSVGAFMKEECLIIVVTSSEGRQPFPCIFMHLSNLFPVVPQSSNVLATFVTPRGCDYLARIFYRNVLQGQFRT